MKRMLEFMGTDPERFQTRWISGSEGPKFQEVITEATGIIKAIGPNKKMRDDLTIKAVFAQRDAEEEGGEA